MAELNLVPSYDCFGFIPSWYDGDTVKMVCDLGQSVCVGPRNYRLFGIAAPEVRGESRREGLRSKEFLGELIETYNLGEYPLGYRFLVKTHKLTREQAGRVAEKRGKYGRYLVELLGKDGAGRPMHLGNEMIAAGKAESYFP
jgi:hypothetical protein